METKGSVKYSPTAIFLNNCLYQRRQFRLRRSQMGRGKLLLPPSDHWWLQKRSPQHRREQGGEEETCQAQAEVPLQKGSGRLEGVCYREEAQSPHGGGGNADKNNQKVAWQGEFVFVFLNQHFFCFKVKARRLLKRSHSLEMIDIIDPDRKNDSEEYDMFDEETEEIAGLLQSRAKKKSKTMTTESVRRLLCLFRLYFSFTF